MGYGDRSMIDTRSFNPDVLSCLANLSNDEVFTPPKLANEILDLLPQSLWSDKAAKFLDPCSKTGVFLREIAKRLLKGLEQEIPNLPERINHIFKNQLYGIAITELTAHLSRRSVYCSKHASGKYSVCNAFDDDSGNVRFERIEHTWKDGKCVFCGANQENYDRGDELETHAYQFIHTEKPEEIFNMKFDVIIGNPPYQLSDEGAFASASPLYHKFVQQAKKMNPRYLVMIIPARWYAGGKGLDNFRKNMLYDDRIRVIHDFPIGSDCFPGTRIAGGVCYFLWDRDNPGLCAVFNHEDSQIVSRMDRPLLETGTDSFIRRNESIPILHKVLSKEEKSFSSIVSARKPYGLQTDFFVSPSKYGYPPISKMPFEGGITIYGTLKYKTVKFYVHKDYPISAGKDWISKYKVFVSQVLDSGFDQRRERLKPFLGKPNEICTETFLSIGCFDNEQIVLNVISYMNTKLFHLLMFLKKVSHHVVSKVYQYVPMQDFKEPWTDEKLYKKYDLTQGEIAFIESMIRPMEIGERAE
jgi:site-specific DNA-methyltransferase (adenine-specific)